MVTRPLPIIIATLLYTIATSCGVNDPCCFDSLYKHLTKDGRELRYSSIEWMKTCFEALPYGQREKRIKNINIKAVKAAYDTFYAYKDLVLDTHIHDSNPVPYQTFHLQVDLDREFATLLHQEYTNGAQMHFDLAALTYRLRDPHTNYLPPLADTLSYIPSFHLAINMTSEHQPYYYIRGAMEIDNVTTYDLYLAIYGTFLPINEHIGKAIVRVNGVPVQDYYTNLFERICYMKDMGVCFNWYLSKNIFRTVVEVPTMHRVAYEFSDGQVMKVYPYIGRYVEIRGNITALYDRLYSPVIDQHKDIVIEDIKTLLDDKKRVTAQEAALSFNRLYLSSYSYAPGTDIYLDYCDPSNNLCFHATRLNNTMILNLNTFTFTPEALFDFLSIMVKSAYHLGLHNLLIDASKNGGGEVESAVALARLLVIGWESRDAHEPCVAVDFRKSRFWNMWEEAFYRSKPSVNTPFTPVDIEALGLLRKACVEEFGEHAAKMKCEWLEEKSVTRDMLLNKVKEHYTPHDDEVYGHVGWFSTGNDSEVMRVRGGVKGLYIPIHHDDDDCFQPSKALEAPAGTPFHFKDIRIVSDGQCGSSCSLFVSTMWLHKKAKIITYGGIYGKPLNFASFTGGNVERDLDFWRRTVFGAVAGAVATGNYTVLEHLKSLTLASKGTYGFTWHEAYFKGHRKMEDNPLPRDFYLIPGDYHINVWPTGQEIGQEEAMNVVYKMTEEAVFTDIQPDYMLEVESPQDPHGLETSLLGYTINSCVFMGLLIVVVATTSVCLLRRRRRGYQPIGENGVMI